MKIKTKLKQKLKLTSWCRNEIKTQTEITLKRKQHCCSANNFKTKTTVFLCKLLIVEQPGSI